MSANERRRQTWYFTFGVEQPNRGRYVVIENATFDEARTAMFARFGRDWAFQYSADEWTKPDGTLADRHGLELLIP